MKILVKKIAIGLADNNCYIISTKNKKAVVVDAPDTAEETNGIKKVIDYIGENDLKVEYILITHGHYDHIWGLDQLKESTGGKVVISKDCNYMLESEEDSLGMSSPFYTHPKTRAEILVENNDVLSFDDIMIKIHLVPGHTKGDTVYEIGDHIFTGDTLFAGDIGRGDLPYGNLEKLITNLKKLVTLDENFKVHPGHGPDTTIAHEKRYNHYLK